MESRWLLSKFMTATLTQMPLAEHSHCLASAPAGRGTLSLLDWRIAAQRISFQQLFGCRVYRNSSEHSFLAPRIGCCGCGRRFGCAAWRSRRWHTHWFSYRNETSVAAPHVTRLISEWMTTGLVSDRWPCGSPLEERIGAGRIEGDQAKLRWKRWR
jgi:hypothetical protein